jgi:hypothetical protein
MRWDGLTEDELQQQDAHQATGVDEEGSPQRSAKLLVEFGVGAGLERIGSSGGYGDEQDKQVIGASAGLDARLGVSRAASRAYRYFVRNLTVAARIWSWVILSKKCPCLG